MATYRLRDRAQLMQNVQKIDWDMIVVGGGITGAGVLREAARLGLKVLLLEQQDFAWGTSSRSSKMVHGGLRYLAMGDITLTKHSLHERERLLREAPGLVERMGYYFVLNKHKSPPKFGVKIVLWLYDIIAGVKYHRSVRLPDLQEKFKALSISSLKAAFYYTDAITDDSRLVQRVLQESIDDGAAALNYMRVSKLLQDADGEVRGVVVEQGSESVDVRAKVVVNATGAWADVLRQQVQSEKRVRPLRGSHIVVDQKDLPIAAALTLAHPQDNRSVFIFPWENRTVIGTTDLDHKIDLDIEANISAQEVNYLLALANNMFPDNQLSVDHIISTWAGVRPVIASASGLDPSKEKRNHAVWKDGQLITVSGGKLTTFRLIAEDVLAQVDVASLLENHKPKDKPQDGRVFAAITLTANDLQPCDPAIAQILLSRYGDKAKAVVDLASDEPSELTLIEYSRWCLAECRWALREESVLHLDDLLLRRTRLGLLLAGGAECIFPQLKIMCQQELDWTDGQWADELARYKALWQKHYFVPEELMTINTDHDLQSSTESSHA